MQEEREKSSEAMFTEIAKDVAARCVNPDTSRPYTIVQIERAMKDVHVSVQPTHTSKKQALEVIKLLQETIPIKRAQMRLQIRLPKANVKANPTHAPSRCVPPATESTLPLSRFFC